ncbi:hypothetical protein Q1695_007141 [Nippostrongylus brasiliensis]|nr:hypothetical protein Q1695_007141 [Nippostrongylus brasiliensis]
MIQTKTSRQFMSGCRCDLDGDSYDFCYRLPANLTRRGQRFSCLNAPYMKKLDLLSPICTFDVNNDDFPEPMFVTAMSDDHLNEGLTLIANIRRIWPQRKLIVYNLGINSKLLGKLKAKCLVEVRDFPFADYPSYVKNLMEYRWKPLIIAMTLKEFGAIWYMDTSVRWQSDRLQVVYDEVLCRKDHDWQNKTFDFYRNRNTTTECGKSAYMLQSSSNHGIFPTTDPGVYKFIPTEIESLKTNTCMNHDAGFVFAVRTPDALEILTWYVLCALEKDCMAPPGAQLWCHFGKERFVQYAKCHRYDQSVINLLLANAYGYNSINYVSNLGKEGASINRTASRTLSNDDFLCNVKT